MTGILLDLFGSICSRFRVATAYLNCVGEAVFTVCGEEASIWAREFDRRTFLFEFEDHSCDAIQPPNTGITTVPTSKLREKKSEKHNCSTPKHCTAKHELFSDKFNYSVCQCVRFIMVPVKTGFRVYF